jgi:hypothetical protein
MPFDEFQLEPAQLIRFTQNANHYTQGMLHQLRFSRAPFFGALIKVIHDLVASELTDKAYDMTISFTVFLALEIIVCFIIACVNIDLNDNAAAFHRFSFLFALIVMG